MPDWQTWLQFILAVVAALVAAVVATLLVTLIVHLVARRRDWPRALVRHTRVPFRSLVVVLGLWFAVANFFPLPDSLTLLNHLFTIAVIGTGAWLLGQFLLFVEDLGVARYRIDVPDNRVARRIRTQMLIVRRLTIVVIAVVAIGSVLLTFPAVRTVGASLLASAGVASIVAGLAAQSILANMFAGLQLAFSNALRVDDVVVVEGQFGRIEEITLSYVVVRVWDDRRLVLPCTYFTTQPFESWTRRSSQLLGAVDFDLDWQVPPAAMRAQLAVILDRTPLWDQRTSVLQVTDAVGGFVHVRILVSAVDAPTLFDLRCLVREEMVTWLQQKQPAGLPRRRVQLLGAEAASDERATDAAPHETGEGGRRWHPEHVPDDADEAADSAAHGAERGGLFTGSKEAEERAGQFTGAISTVPDDEREDAARP
ncbi:mechanosensitive ion channel family protein [Cryobacterium tepidiphilum]|uniref:mechanosensitive ion channel family protein n=1 Tax=Cryobacterium tepidiphilum TaxID=2486026 RepID=UPI001F334403|nr:mechanosensitive ion channel domain-containing protein [Cryobacterium tepidiphilum]